MIDRHTSWTNLLDKHAPVRILLNNSTIKDLMGGKDYSLAILTAANYVMTAIAKNEAGQETIDHYKALEPLKKALATSGSQEKVDEAIANFMDVCFNASTPGAGLLSKVLQWQDMLPPTDDRGRG